VALGYVPASESTASPRDVDSRPSVPHARPGARRLSSQSGVPMIGVGLALRRPGAFENGNSLHPLTRSNFTACHGGGYDAYSGGQIRGGPDLRDLELDWGALAAEVNQTHSNPQRHAVAVFGELEAFLRDLLGVLFDERPY
jgi:hypothetical protein